jgi:hypothetical protein
MQSWSDEITAYQAGHVLKRRILALCAAIISAPFAAASSDLEYKSDAFRLGASIFTLADGFSRSSG